MNENKPETFPYRMYWIGKGGTVDAVALPIAALNDAEATCLAALLAEQDHVEIWFRRRLVARLNAPLLH